jgi:hypothetical protein
MSDTPESMQKQYDVHLRATSYQLRSKENVNMHSQAKVPAMARRHASAC